MESRPVFQTSSTPLLLCTEKARGKATLGAIGGKLDNDDRQIDIGNGYAVEWLADKLLAPRFHAAQVQLCKHLNEKVIRLHNGKRLLYDVGPKPRSVQKITS